MNKLNLSVDSRRLTVNCIYVHDTNDNYCKNSIDRLQNYRRINAIKKLFFISRCKQMLFPLSGTSSTSP